MAPVIERRRRRSAAVAPSGTQPAKPDTAGVVTGLPLVLLRSEGVALLAMAAVLYDLTHTYVPPAALGLAGVVTGSSLAAALALVWFAHIGMDRARTGPAVSGRHWPYPPQGTTAGPEGGGSWTA